MPKQIALRKVSTVNVIHLENGILNGIFSFNDNKLGNKHAEKKFIDLINHHVTEPLTKENADNALDEGHYENGIGDEFFLSHSDLKHEFFN